MQWCRNCWLVLLFIATSIFLNAGTPGSFRGTIIDGPSADKGWIYIQGRNGMARRVEISHAHVTYDEEVPAADRRAKAEEALIVGAEVRITAEQGSDGEWRASEVEILKASGSGKQTALGTHR